MTSPASGRAWLRPAMVATLVDTVGVVPVFLTGALAVRLGDEIGLSAESLGLVYASYFAAAALLSAPLGRVTERTGPELALRVGSAIYVVASLGIAALATSAAWIALFLVVAGVGTAYTRTATSLLLARAVAPGRQGLAFGLKHCSIPAGGLLAGLAVPTIALTVGWRWCYVGAAALALAVGLTVHARPGTTARKPAAADQLDLSLAMLVVFAASFGLGSAAAASLGAYTVVTAVDAGMTEAAAGILVAVGSVVGLASRLLVGGWTDRRTGSQLDVVAWMLLLGALAFVMLGFGGPLVLWFAVPFSFATGWAWLGSFNLAMVRLNPIAPGAAVGVTQTGAFVGAIIGPISLGILAERGSFEAAWLAAAGASAAAAVAVIFTGRSLSRGDEGARRAAVVAPPAASPSAGAGQAERATGCAR